MKDNAFSQFPLSQELLDAVRAAGYDDPLPIQEKVIPAALEGRDIIGCSQTGSGKTAAFLIPIIEDLLEMPAAGRFRPRALVLAPTRELARQVATHFEMLAQFTRLRVAAIHGGAELGEQEKRFQEGVELIAATPGRLLEHLSRGGLRLSEVTYFVIDEADRMLDEGFLPEVRKVVDALPGRRQTMLFSATIPDGIEELAREILFRPERIQVGVVGPADRIVESFWPVPSAQKIELLQEVLKEQQGMEKVMVFVRTRAKARALTPLLRDLTGLATAELHAELTQQERQKALESFRRGELRLLVATDVASRGLDIPQVTHVVNFDVPNTPDDYIHRVGRTGRVDQPGVAITLVSPQELALSASIEEATRRRIPVQRLAGFRYDVPDDSGFVFRPTKHGAQPFRERTPEKPGSKQSPFTKSGELRKELREDTGDNRSRRNLKKRLERRLVRKKLPHQRRRR